MNKIIKKLKYFIRKHQSLKSVTALIGGTATAQVLAILALPILTRVYTPADFNLLAIYVAALALISPISCLRLEIAIPIPEEDNIAANIYALSIISATMFAACSGTILYVYYEDISKLAGYGDIYIPLLPIGIWLAGVYAASQYWATRNKNFTEIAKTRITQAIAAIGIQLGFGVAGAGAFGLMLGHAFMGGVGAISLSRNAIKRDREKLSTISLSGMRIAFRTFSKFPTYSVLDALINNAAIQVPVFIIASVAVGPEAGFLLLATRVLGAPVTMIGNAASQIYISQAPSEMRAENLAQYTNRTTKWLATMSIVPMLVIAVISPSVFEIFFGVEWRRAGEMVSWLMPWYMLKLLASPISMVMHIKMKQEAMLLLTTFGLVLRLAAVLIASKYYPDFVFESYAIAGAIFYLIAFIIFFSTANSSTNR
jgi:O-antigen/teichoic acid export membrane protein